MQSFLKNPELTFIISDNDVLKFDKKKLETKSNQYSIEFSKDELDILRKLNDVECKESNNDEIPKKSPKKHRGKKKEVTLSELKSIKSQLGDDKYLCDVLDKIEVKLPENEIVERNPELEERVQRLKAQQSNLEYNHMTKNVDSRRKANEPTESISYQLKQINRQLIAVAQFIFSVISGFAFGFMGIELIVGELDFGFRLLLGIICALVIALAEIYFLAKKLIEEEREEEKAKIVDVKPIKVDTPKNADSTKKADLPKKVDTPKKDEKQKKTD
ncbi:transmembrane protein 199 [Chironomus tepperi]|uniref:transmembrane protein 199 n=1 Tax=Chironomus tepperi TaxID=113505 RepID=UPI00391F7AD8